MIEREFIREKIKSLNVKNKIAEKVTKAASIADVSIEKTPLGEKVIITAVRPGMVIGRGGEAINALTNELKTKYKLENPQIEVKEVLVPALSARVVANRIAYLLERFGPSRYKALGYRNVKEVMDAGAMGVEITISGRGVPGKRSRTWRFWDGYLKKCGDVSESLVDYAVSRANLRSGSVGVQVKILPPNTPLPDKVEVKPAVKLNERSESEAEMIRNSKEAREKQKSEPIKEEKKEPKKTEKKASDKDKKAKKPAKKKETANKEVKKSGNTKAKRNKKSDKK